MTRGDYDPRSDLELVEAANRGDAGAFEALYRRYRDWAARLACRFTRSADEAADVVQETFLYLLKKFPGFKLTAHMTTFLYPVVKHIAINLRRRGMRFAQGGDPFDSVEAPREKSAGRGELAAALGALPEPQREVVLMRFVDSMTLAEISAALDIPLGTVKSRLHNALSILRDDPRTREYFLG